MSAQSRIQSALSLLATGAGAAAGGYAAYAGLAWCRYGHPARGSADDRDEFLDRFMPEYEVVERHRVRVAAPAAAVLAAAKEQNVMEAPITRAVFKAREMVLRSTPRERRRHPPGLLKLVQSLGWGVLADVPGREIVLGAVTKPWEPNVTFRALPPAEFAAFAEPGYVKIVWTLRADPADPVDDTATIFRSETRAMATDAAARSRFRRYWAFASPGISIIRRLMLGSLRARYRRRGCIAPLHLATHA